MTPLKESQSNEESWTEAAAAFIATEDDKAEDSNKTPSSPPPPESPPKSPFRQSLEMVHSRDRDEPPSNDMNDPIINNGINGQDGASPRDGNAAQDPKTLLRHSLSTTILTTTERTFLESLLNIEDGILADRLCGVALRRLCGEDFSDSFASNAVDGSLVDGENSKEVGEELNGRREVGTLNVFSMCDGGELCLENRMPGHGWRAAPNHVNVSDGSGGSLNNGDWVEEWVTRGSESREQEEGLETKLETDSLAKALPYSLERTGNIITSGADGASLPKEQDSTAPSKPTQQQQKGRQPSITQANRLAYKKRQSSSGNDTTTRLYRAHEAGLILSQQGSAKRSLQRLGLNIQLERVDTGAENGITPAGRVSAASHRHASTSNKDNTNDTATGTTNGTAISNSKQQERSIHKLEQAERSKQKHRQHALAELDVLSSKVGGTTTGMVVSPFTGNFLRNIYASKQFSFKRSESSYSRYDSFLNESNSRSASDVLNESGHQASQGNGEIGITETESTALSSGETGSMTSEERDQPAPASRQDIFRRTTERRLQSLLVSAGFGSETTPRGTRLVVAEDNDEYDALSVDTSVEKLLKSGGPSFREESVFRREDDNSVEDELKPKVVDTKKDEGISTSFLSSLGSSFAPTPSSTSNEFFPVESTASRDEDDEEEEEREVVQRRATDSPTNSEVGELPPPLSARNSLHKRNSTISIMKSSSSSSLKRSQYRRSVSWGHMVVKESADSSSSKMERSESEAATDAGISVISFPNLRRAVPIRSDSIGSVASSAGPLRLATPLRSESMSSVVSAPSAGVPIISRAHPVFSPLNSVELRRIPSLHRAVRLRSESTNTLGTEGMDDELSAYSFSEYDDSSRMVLRQRSSGAAWASPFAPKRWLPPRRSSLSRQSSAASLTGKNILIRQASQNNYEGEGMEIDEFDYPVSLGSARNFKSMLSMGGGDSVVSGRSRSSRSIPVQSLDDSFVVRNVNFERHSSEILRSLSNEDLYWSHHVETLGGSANSVARVYGDLMEGDSKSWDLQDESEFAAPQNAWNVFEDEYAEEYGAYNSLTFQILGTSADDAACHPHVLSPPLMESLQNFLPVGIAENNFMLKYSLVRDGATLPTLLRQIRGSQHTLIAMETVDGEVFGCFTSSPWRKTWNYYGSGESFLWRMRRTRADKDVQRSILDQAKLESELDVFYWTGKNQLVQLCTHDMLAVGGGTFHSFNGSRQNSLSDGDSPPQSNETDGHKADKGGFGLAIDADLLRGTSSHCATFNSPPMSREHSDGSPFEIVNLEVWTMTPCMNVEDAEQFEMRKLFLEPYSGTQ